MKIFLSSSLFLTHIVITSEWSLRLSSMLTCRDSTSRSFNDLRLVCRVGRMCTVSIAWEIALVVVIILLILCKGIRWSVLMDSSDSNRSTCVVDIVACVTCVDTSRHIHSVSATSCCATNKTTACSIIMLSTMVIELSWGSCWFIVLRIPWRVLSTVLIAMTDNILSLIVVSWVLRSRIVFEAVRSEQYLITTLIVIVNSRSSVASWRRSTSHHHGWFISVGHSWSRSLLLLISFRVGTMRLAWRRTRLGVFALWTS